MQQVDGKDPVAECTGRLTLLMRVHVQLDSIDTALRKALKILPESGQWHLVHRTSQC